MRKLIKKLNAFQLYTLLFIILTAITFFLFFKSGRSLVWMTDGFKQHYIFLQDFYTSIKNGFSSFSWSLGLGLDKIGQLSYYILGDPFAYISLLFPIASLKYVYTALVLVRMYCVGLSFIFYCRYHKKSKYSTLIGALMYTFSGFIIYASIRHPFFANTAIWLPLIFLGIDKILKQDRYRLFTIMTAITAISNYYFFYMISILMFIYAIVKYFCEYKQKGMKVFWAKLFKTIICYIIGVLSASILLLPTIYAFANNSRSIDIGYTYYDFDYYANLITMNTKTPFWTKTYVAPIVLTMLPIAILNFKKSKENRTLLINLGIQTIILLIPFLGSLMNGFSFQSNRWVFAYSFILSYLVTVNIRPDLIYSPKEFKAIKKFLILYLIIWFILNGSTGIFPAVNFFIAFMFLIILVARSLDYKELKANQYFQYIKNYKTESSRKAKRIVKVVLLGFLCLDILFFNLQRIYNSGYYKEFIKYSALESKYDSLSAQLPLFSDAVNYVQKRDNSFYRIATHVSESNNESLMYGYHGLNTYLSVGNKYLTNLSRDLLILNNSKTNALREFDSRTRITTLLGTKYYITSKNRVNHIPYGYKLIHEIPNAANEDKSAYIYENQYALPIGVFYNNYTLKNDYEKLSPLEKEQMLLKTAVIDDASTINTYNISRGTNNLDTINKPKEVNYEIRKNKVQDGNTIKVTKDHNSFNLIINDSSVANNSELYLLINNLDCSKTGEYTVTARYNGVTKKQAIRDRVTSPYYVKTPQILFNLGYQDEHYGKIKLTIDLPATYTFDNIKLLALPIDNYEQDVNQLKKSEFNLISYDDKKIVGTISNKEDGILQISTSFSSGWKAFVDNKETDIININTGFVGIPLNSGNHKIEFVYTTPYLDLGAKLSSIGLGLIILVFVVDIIHQIKRRKTKK